MDLDKKLKKLFSKSQENEKYKELLFFGVRLAHMGASAFTRKQFSEDLILKAVVYTIEWYNKTAPPELNLIAFLKWKMKTFKNRWKVHQN